ncbi:hypothetical protein G6O69_08965 [Pseudenhygromyxa sp. WMMC2535]|uniref:hypothetical protein n=1 Tax=Pseudenhygromyxa sp. WMMC2535 TaxID=2712867 RepID=UPI0015565462|nr:hypothetical protein [Pseudenhygromyxa sp. WMMC2535]NVB37965.1 hypothetical protein [Pseudenhygromyxa sp. WMMC2535]
MHFFSKNTALTPLIAGALLAAPLAGCALVGIEPDEIDIADGDEETGVADEVGEDTEGDAGTTGGDGDATGGEDAADDDSTEDSGSSEGTDGGTEDGGTEEETDDGEEDTGSEESDTGEESSCEAFDAIALGLDELVDFEIPAGSSAFESDCGAPGPELLYAFTAEEAGSYEAELSNLAEPVAFYLAVECDPLETAQCNLGDTALVFELAAGETAYFVVDAEQAGAVGTVTVILP